MPINSRNKGAAFERQIANRLYGLTGVKFLRDLDQYRESDRGDLIPDDPAWPFIVECKRYAKGTGCKPAWRDQAMKSAIKAGRYPAVVYQFDRCDVWVSVPVGVVASIMGGENRKGFSGWAEISLEGLAFLGAEAMAATHLEAAE